MPNTAQLILLDIRRKANFPEKLTGVEKVLFDALGQAGDDPQTALFVAVTEVRDELDVLNKAIQDELVARKKHGG